MSAEERLFIFDGTKVCDTSIILKSIVKNYDSENLLYLEKDRKLTITKDDIEMTKFTFQLEENGYDLQNEIEEAYDIKDQFAFENCKYGERINSGYLQLINLFFNIYLHKSDNLIVAIDLIEQNLHELLRVKLVKDILKFKKVKRLIITTYSQSILECFSNNIFN